MSNGTKATDPVREFSPRRQWPTRKTSSSARVGGTKALQEIFTKEREATADQIVLEVLALGFAKVEGLSKKALEMRMLHMSGRTCSLVGYRPEYGFRGSRASRGRLAWNTSKLGLESLAAKLV